MIATLGSMERLTGTKMVREFEQGFTDDWDIHLQADELEELEAVNAGHENITDNHVELVIPVLPFPEHLQRRLRLCHCCHCYKNSNKKEESTKNKIIIWPRPQSVDHKFIMELRK